MKLKFIVNTIEKLFGLTYNGDGCRADMYLPDRLLAMSLVFFAAGLGCGVYSFFKFSLITVIIAVLGIILGIFSLLCWKNQTIDMISNDQFTYTTMFGNKYTYNFSDVYDVRYNKDSLTIFVADKKVHIEAMAIISDRFANAVNAALMINSKYNKMTTEELASLSDDELFETVWKRAESIIELNNEISNAFNFLNDEQRIFYAINYFEMEVNNGGLCQFFVNSSRIFAPSVSEYMEIIGATEHKKLFDTFIEKNQINLYNLSSFDCETVEDFELQYERYPFEEFDDEFYELDPLQKYLIPYIRKNIDKF